MLHRELELSHVAYGFNAHLILANCSNLQSGENKHGKSTSAGVLLPSHLQLIAIVLNSPNWHVSLLSNTMAASYHPVFLDENVTTRLNMNFWVHTYDGKTNIATENLHSKKVTLPLVEVQHHS